MDTCPSPKVHLHEAGDPVLESLITFYIFAIAKISLILSVASAALGELLQ